MSTCRGFSDTELEYSVEGDRIGLPSFVCGDRVITFWTCNGPPASSLVTETGGPFLGTFAALDQRIALRYAITGMNLDQTKGYLAHQLGLVGRSDTLFSDDAVALIHQVSRGLPRTINNLAIQSLVAAFAASKAIVDESSARAAVTEVTTE